MDTAQLKANLQSAYVYPEMRKEQVDCINQIIDNIHKKYFICQLDVGIGKSGIAMTMANLLGSTFVVTGTKQLQDQYITDFERSQNVIAIKGKANYPCIMNEELNCETGPCNFKMPGDKFPKCFMQCEYYRRRQEALSTNTVVTSYAYLLRAFECAGFWQKRHLVVFDECHLIEDQLINFAEFSLNPKELDKEFDLFSNFTRVKGTAPFTEDGFGPNELRIRDIYTLSKNRREAMFNEMKAQMGDGITKPEDLTDDQLSQLKSTHSYYYRLDKLVKKLGCFLDTFTNDTSWLISVNDEGGLDFKPIFMNSLFKNYVSPIGEKFIFMSATILDIDGYIKELGLPPEECCVINIASPFEPARSPIYVKNTGSMNLREIDNTLPKVVTEIESLLKKYDNQKGIIHTGNYKVAKYIYDNTKTYRFLYKNDETVDNYELVKMHSLAKDTVLLSPSMTTGVDLKDDLSRFQVICKLPFKSLGDKRIEIKSKLDPKWYATLMLKDLIQACGRSTRSEFDYSDTYILDSAFLYWIQKYVDILPRNFLERLSV